MSRRPVTDDSAVAELTSGRVIISGGGSFVGRVGTVTATYPFLRLTSDATGVSLDVRPKPLRRLLGGLLAERTSPSEPMWAQRWEDLVQVTVGPQSVVLSGSGSECRFIVLRRRELAPLLAAAQTHGVPIVRRATTLGWYLRPRRTADRSGALRN